MASITERAKRSARRLLPPRVFRAVHDLPFALADARSGSWNGDERVPPLRLMRDGPRSREAFLSSGAEVVPFYRDVLGIEPDAAILDIGSGIGRKTIPLVDYLEGGRYVGLDIDAELVDWCTRHISTRNPRFSFVPVSIHNSFYNPKGALRPEEFVFPFPDDAFDAVVLWSVFTHLSPDTIEHYLGEIRRVLKPGGRLGASFFVLDDHAFTEIRAGRTLYPVKHRMDGFWTSNPTMPEDLIAIERDWLEGALERAGFQLDELRLGSWANRDADPRYPQLNTQDVVVATAG